MYVWGSAVLQCEKFVCVCCDIRNMNAFLDLLYLVQENLCLPVSFVWKKCWMLASLYVPTLRKKVHPVPGSWYLFCRHLMQFFSVLCVSWWKFQCSNCLDKFSKFVMQNQKGRNVVCVQSGHRNESLFVQYFVCDNALLCALLHIRWETNRFRLGQMSCSWNLDWMCVMFCKLVC